VYSIAYCNSNYYYFPYCESERKKEGTLMNFLKKYGHVTLGLFIIAIGIIILISINGCSSNNPVDGHEEEITIVDRVITVADSHRTYLYVKDKYVGIYHYVTEDPYKAARMYFRLRPGGTYLVVVNSDNRILLYLKEVE
jgi:hypothetical protein